MYCTNCGAPISAGLSYCNRCGANLREKETPTSKTAAITAFLTAITLIAAIGLGIMLGGALALRTEAGMAEQLVGIYMLFTFLITAVTEVMLIRQLSRITSAPESRPALPPVQTTAYELRSAPGEPIASVTDNTTRTLEYARRERN
jgi:predicted nucleic acid-binding Zn ribbon protein